MIKIELNKFSAIGIVVFVIALKTILGTMSRMKKFRKW